MDEPLGPRVKVCAVCGRLPDFYKGTWIHLADLIQGTQDHPVVPVDPGEVFAAGRCDFCNGPNPGFVVPARSFGAVDSPDIRMPDGAVTKWASEGDWAACAECAPLIERNEWGAVLRRHIGGRDLPPVVVSDIRRLLRQLRANITGPIRPFKFPQPSVPPQ